MCLGYQVFHRSAVGAQGKSYNLEKYEVSNPSECGEPLFKLIIRVSNDLTSRMVVKDQEMS